MDYAVIRFPHLNCQPSKIPIMSQHKAIVGNCMRKHFLIWHTKPSFFYGIYDINSLSA